MGDLETVLMSIRREPHKAVRIEWLEGSQKGREVIWDSQSVDGSMHIKMPGPFSILPIKMDPESPLVKQNSRHSIRGAGFDTILARMEEALPNEGNSSVPDPRHRLELFELNPTPGRSDACPALRRLTPSGETWIVAFDSDTHLPVYLEAKDTQGSLIEQHLFGSIQANPSELATQEAFDPEHRWRLSTRATQTGSGFLGLR